MDLTIKTLEIGGFIPSIYSMRLPFKANGKSDTEADFSIITPNITNSLLETHTNFKFGHKDKILANKLVLNGDEHAKSIRGIIVWCEIDAPRYWWQEMDTYRFGHERLSSESTMHVEAKGLSGKELQEFKSEYKEGNNQTRVDLFSYQTLRRIYFQRKNHRLPEWHQFCNWIEELPYSNLLITCERNNDKTMVN